MVLSKGCRSLTLSAVPDPKYCGTSRTVHSGKCPTHGRAHARNRYVVYTSYLPQTKMRGKRAEKKRKAVIDGRMTSHWADVRRVFQATPYTRGGPLIDLPPYKNQNSQEGPNFFGWSDVKRKDVSSLEEEDSAEPPRIVVEV